MRVPTPRGRRRARPRAAVVLSGLMLLTACGRDDPATATASSSAGTTTVPATAGTGPATTPGQTPAPGAEPDASIPPPPSGPLPALRLSSVAQLRSPTAAAVRAGERSLYVTEQAGRVRRIRIEGSAADPSYSVDDDPVLDIGGDVVAGGEQGLLGIAFSPAGDRVFIAYTNRDEQQELVGLAVDGDGIDADSRQRVLVVPDFASNHNGGQLAFGPDGFLYWAMGDGGGANDPEGNGQKTDDLLGNILRIDPLGGSPYAIPADNPFVNGGGAPEVYAFGLRNPWRFSFDRATGDLWIADVGQGDWEEIDFVPAGAGRGANFGWDAVEGSHPFAADGPPAGAVGPLHEYDHGDGSCSVTGGYVYRGTTVPGLVGTYLFADFCRGRLMGLRRTAEGVVVDDIGLDVDNPSSFGEGPDGELYVLSLGGEVARLDPG
ncbi:MAG: PQQ-dependent sugar dehydrogenase [Acidimicrobiia bacterium]